MCLTKGVMKPFLKSTSEPFPRPAERLSTYCVYCHCRLLEEFDHKMVECTRCKAWYHVTCVGLNQKGIPTHWKCDKCSTNNVVHWPCRLIIHCDYAVCRTYPIKKKKRQVYPVPMMVHCVLKSRIYCLDSRLTRTVRMRGSGTVYAGSKVIMCIKPQPLHLYIQASNADLQYHHSRCPANS